MKLNRVNSAIDRNERNKINENFDILERNYGRAAMNAQYAVETSDEAKQKAESTQIQLNQIVIEGDSSVEAAQARVSLDDTVYKTLKERLDAENEQVAEQLTKTARKLSNPFNFNFKNGVITIIDDDAPANIMSTWKSVADANGIKLSIAVNTQRIGASGYLTLTELQQLKDEGHDILSHLHDHIDLATSSLEDIEYHMLTSLNRLKETNLGDDLALVYTKGLATIPDAEKVIKIKELTRKYYKYGIDASGGVNYLPVDSYEVRRRSVNLGTDSLTNISSWIDEAHANNGWLIILTHAGLGWNASLAQEIIDYINAKKMQIMTFREVEDLVGNVISHGDTRTPNYHFVSKNGATMDSRTRKPFMNPIPIQSMDAPISYYDYGKETDVLLNTTQDTLLSAGGTMKVYRGNKFYSYALYFPARRNNVFRRYWDDDTETWSAWVDLSTVSSETIVITKDLSIVETQNIPITIKTKMIKKIKVFGAVNGTKKTVIGEWNATNKSCVYQDGTSGNSHTTNIPIVFSQDSAANRTSGQFQVPIGSLRIEWLVLSGTGATGNAQLTLEIEYV